MDVFWHIETHFCIELCLVALTHHYSFHHQILHQSGTTRSTQQQYNLDQYTGPIQPPAPLVGGLMTGATYYMRAGPRVAALAGTIGMGAVGATFGLYSILGIPYGSKGWLWF